MEIRRIENQTVSKWSGGTTTQLAIWPEDAKYADRNFLWRLSTATVDDPDSTFTSLPDYTRFLAVRQGMMRMCHGGNDQWIVMTPGKIDLFDGGVETVSHGQVTDFNLMVRKGEGKGAVQFRHVSAEDTFAVKEMFQIREAVRETEEDLCRRRESFFGLYLAAGAEVKLSQGEDTHELHNGDLVLWKPGEAYDEVMLHACGDADLYGVWIEKLEP